jgi:hypothetical protein
MLAPTTPRRVDPAVRDLLSHLGIDDSDAVFLEYKRPRDFKPELAECHVNVLVQCKVAGGKIVTGWTIWQDRSNAFVEAQYHSVWESPNRRLIDITPRQDKERRILFAPDPRIPLETFTHDGQPAIRSFANFSVHQGRVHALPEPHTRILTTSLLKAHAITFAASEAYPLCQ